MNLESKNKNNFKPWIKDERRIKAEQHTEDMDKYFHDDIVKSIENSVVYYDEDIKSDYTPNIIVDAITTDGAVMKYTDTKYCVLNFASFNYPGGGFIIGAIAQEEAICHASNLFNIIGDEKFMNYYLDNRNNNNGGLYKNFAIFTPDVKFVDAKCDHVYNADVITCPAPNMSAFHGSESVGRDTMDKRIKFILDIAKKHNVKNLILGAFGCGVFKNDPEFVAYTFKKYLDDENYKFDSIIFAIPAGSNYDIFKKVFE